MPVIPRDLGQAALTTADQTVYTCPAATTCTLRMILVSNTTAAARTVKVYKVPSGKATDDARVIMPDISVPAHGLAWDDSIHVLEAGGKIVAHAAGVGLTITLDGAEVT